MNLFRLAEQCLHASNVEAKLTATLRARSALKTGMLDLTRQAPPRPIAETLFPISPLWVDPRQLIRRRLGTVAGRVALLHAVAHIEFVAIHLAWDHLYRFPELPDAYYCDWLEVAGEEALHFQMLRDLLRAFGADYGDLPVHGGLWSVAVDTAADLPARMALVPRYMEARGLDVTPGMIERLVAVGDHASVAVLQRILNDEVEHVRKGTRWFQYACTQAGIAPEDYFQTTVRQYFRGAVRGPFNYEMRVVAGFTQPEIDWLERVAGGDRSDS